MLNSKPFTIENNIIKGQKINYNINKQSIGEWVYDTLNESPDHIGQIEAETGEPITHADIKKASVSLALWMKKQGIGPNDNIVVCSPNHSHVIKIISAIFYVGANYNPWDHELDLRMARISMKAAKPNLIFTYNSTIDAISEAARLENFNVKIIAFDNHPNFEKLTDLLKTQSSEEIENFKVSTIENPDDRVCVTTFTSGTTGNPKLVANSYTNVLKKMMSSDLDYDTGIKNNHFLTYMYPAWDVHTWFALVALKRKYIEIIHPNFDVKETSRIIEKYKISILVLHTYKLIKLIQENFDNRYNFESVKVVYPVGTKLNIKAIDQSRSLFPNAFLHIMLGITETGLISTHTDKCRNPHSAGTVVPNAEVKVIDVYTGESLGPNTQGELCVKTSTGMMGYCNNPEAMKAAFDDEGWYHTGDVASYDNNGEITMGGRLKEIIKYRLFDLYPSRFEVLLEAHPEVMHAAAVPVPHPTEIERPLAFVQKQPGSKVSEEDLAKLTYSHDRYKMSKDEIKFIDQMPRKSNGKIDKFALIEMAKNYAQ